MTDTELTISDVASRTGVTEATLRMWETRHAFPSPSRSGAGHRRYSEMDVEQVRRVVSERSGGMSLSAAIRRAQDDAPLPLSVFAALRSQRPDLEPRTIRVPLLLALTKAIEDESLSRASRPLFFASFQRQSAYQRQRARWEELARGARLSVVFADFKWARAEADGPIEVPIEPTHPLARELALVCCAADHAACLAAWEPPGQSDRPVRDRVFETIWSVDTQVVWAAARVCAGVARQAAPESIASIDSLLERDPEPSPAEQAKLSTAVTARLLSYLS
jgi:DNA-binding transcriptional MerR regulator